MGISILTVCYLIASVTFILGLKMLSNPATARRGNFIAAGGMALAIIGTIFLYQDPDNGQGLHNYGWIFGGIFIGGILGTLAARKVKMTAMPELVSLFNGMGGACAALISIVEFGRLVAFRQHRGRFTEYMPYPFGPDASTAEGLHSMFLVPKGELLIILAGLVIGSVSFAGSMIAWGKLNGKIKDLAFKGQHITNLFVFLLILAGAAYLLWNIDAGIAIGTEGSEHKIVHFLSASWVTGLFYGVFILALVYGILFVLPIGGADMPVVISILNSFTGVAAACGGFLYDNKAMLTGGILVGAAGTLLTILMCKAMNRSIMNVLIGSFGAGAATKKYLSATRRWS
jgi:H+-translocating NAD(P) transhydrogenase subunit beta